MAEKNTNETTKKTVKKTVTKDFFKMRKQNEIEIINGNISPQTFNVCGLHFCIITDL